MSKRKITKQQVKLYMKYRENNTQVTAAAKAGISERSARRIDKNELQPKAGQPRTWRTRKDPLVKVWDDIVVPILSNDPSVTAVGIFDYLCENHADKFDTRSRRTLERRIKKWRHLYGPPKEVMFLQTHPLGALGIADFTYYKTAITINGEPLEHRLFHYRMPASGWSFVQVIYGGESFVAFSDALQNAFIAAQGVPKELRTDSLSAAYKNREQKEDFTQRFKELAAHYSFTASRNNRGVAHENGAIEAAHRHLKAQIEQAIKMRGSNDFESRKQYERFVDGLVQRRNRRIHDNYLREKRQLQPLPRNKSVNYSERYVSVSRSSTVSIKRVTYTVPSQLIGSRLLARVYDNKIELFLGCELALTLERVYGAQGRRRVRSVNYKHVIDALVKKPRAFRQSQLRDDLLPNDNYRLIWQYVDENLSPDKACYYIVKLLYLAKRGDCERQLEQFVTQGIQSGQLPSMRKCEQLFLPAVADIPEIHVVQHSLKAYDVLIGGEQHA